MTPPVRRAARLLVVVLPLLLPPPAAYAQDRASHVARAPAPAPALQPWKAAYARRLARAPEAIDPDGPAATSPRRPPRKFVAAATALSTNTIVNSRIGDSQGSAQCGTSIAALENVVVAAWNDGQGVLTGSDTQGWATSADGGVTWIDRGELPHAPGKPGFTWLSDPVLAVNEKTGAFYFSAVCQFGSPAGPRMGVGVIKGRWNGTTIAWNTPVVVHDSPFAHSEFPDKSRIVADSVSGRVYVTFTQLQSGLSRILFQRSDSNAVAWSAPQQLSLDTAFENGFVQGSRPAVDGDGRLYVVYELIGQGFADFYRIRRSDDQGLTFSPPVVAESLYTNFGTGPPGFNRPHGIDFSGIAVDRSHGPHRGRIYLSWAESINWLDEVPALGTLGNFSEREENSTPATANPITLGVTIRGTVRVSSDADYYAVTLTPGQHLVVMADSTQAAGVDAMTLRMIAGDGITRLAFTTFDSSVNPTPGNPSGFPVGWMFTAPVAGTYYIRVAPRFGFGVYRLRTGEVHRDLERGRDQRDVFVGHSDDGLTWSDPVRLSQDAPGFDSFTPEVAVAPDGGAYCSWYDYRDAAAVKDGGEASVYLARSGDGGVTWNTLGALTDSVSDWTAAVSNIAPNQADYMALFASGSTVWTLWSDARRGDPDAFVARTPIVRSSLPMRFHFEPATLNTRSRGRWVMGSLLPAPPHSARDIDIASIRLNGVVPVDPTAPRLIRGGGSELVVRFDRTDVAASVRAGARTPMNVTGTMGGESFAGSDTVRVVEPGGTTPVSEEIESSVGDAGLALAVRGGSPARVAGGPLRLWVTLDGGGPARVDLIDIAGRVMATEPVAPLGPGSHELDMATGGTLRPGIYYVRLRQGSREVWAKAAVVGS